VVRTSLLIGLIAVVGVLEGSAQAQSTSLFGSSGPRANSTTASRSSSSSSASSMSRSASSTGGAGTGGARASGAGTGAGGEAFQGPQLGMTGDLSAQAVGNGTGFVGAANTGFIGDRMAGTSGMSTTQRPSFGALGAGRGGSDFNSQNQTQQGPSATRNFRPRFRVGFEYTPSATSVSQRAAATMTRLTTRNPALAGLQINVDDAGMAEIRGTAPNADARTLIENVVRLEPGVRGVTNLIVVAPPAAANP
jgi:hypothetical protein